ncbi:MAG: 4Fe-4S binding protein [Candidatus Woesearchaeota archaeon]
MLKRGKLNTTTVRRIVQVLFLIFILYGGILGVTKAFGYKPLPLSAEEKQAAELNSNLQPDPRLDLYLPIRSCKNANKDLGVFKGCGMYMITSVLMYRTFLSFALPILVLILLIFVFGRTWCGWACPMGLFQELFDRLRSMLKINYLRLSRKTNRMLRKIRYGWLATIFLVSFAIALPVWGTMRKDLHNINCLTCPTRYALQFFPKVHVTYMSFETSYYIIGSIILLLFISLVILSFFVRRFWCRLCPNGALLSLFNKGCLTNKEKDINKCTKCGICYRICPMDNEDVYRVRDRKVVNSKNCVMCFECVSRCPEDDCLQVKVAGKTVLKSKYKAGHK